MNAGLPTAEELYDTIVDCLVHRDWAANELKRLFRPQRNDAIDRFDSISLETLLLWVSDIYDSNLEFFSFLDDYTTPDSLHLRFARAAISGMQIATTNFDDLLEQAILLCGGQPQTIEAQGARQNSLAATSIVKLHGARRFHSLNRVRSRARSIQATTEAIARMNPGSLLDDSGEKLLQNMVNGRTLVVCGYSGNDVFDVVPALRSASPAQVIWIDHREAPITHRRLTQSRNNSAAWRALANEWIELGIPVNVWRGSSDAIVDRLGLPIPLITTTVTNVGVTWPQRIKKWSASVRKRDPSGLGLSALVFGELGRYALVEKALQLSRPSPHQRVGWTRSRRLYELAQTMLLKIPSDPKGAFGLGLKALDSAENSGDHGLTNLCHLLLGRAALFQQDWDEARRHFLLAEASASSGSYRKAFAMGWLGRTEQWQGNSKDARRWLQKSVRLFRSNGELEGLVDSLEALGHAEKSLGNPGLSFDLFKEANQLAQNLGYLDRRYTSLESLAECSYLLGDLKTAQETVLEALDLVKGIGNDEISAGWSLLTLVELELWNLTKAKSSAYRAIRQTTIIDRDQTADRWAMLSEIHWLDGHIDLARKSARRALAQPSECSSAWGRAHAMAVLVASGGQVARAHRDDLDLALKTIRSGPVLIEAASSLRRLGIDTDASGELATLAQEYAKRVAANYWISELDHFR